MLSPIIIEKIKKKVKPMEKFPTFFAQTNISPPRGRSNKKGATHVELRPIPLSVIISIYFTSSKIRGTETQAFYFVMVHIWNVYE